MSLCARFGLLFLLGLASPVTVAAVASARGPSSGGVDAVGPSIIATLPYGSGDGAVGYLAASESAPEGPAAVAVAADGTILVLDGISGAIERIDHDGQSLPSIPLPDPGFEDLIALPNGGFLLLDRLVMQRIVQLDPVGAFVHAWPLPPEPEPGLATALLWADGVFVEYEHGPTQQLLDARLTPVTPEVSRSGRPDGFGAVRARRVGPRFVVIVATVRGQDREAAIAFSGDLHRLLGVERRPDGGLFLLAEVATPGTDGEGPIDAVRDEGVWLTADLREERRASVSHPWDPAQPLRSLASGARGDMIQLAPDGLGVRVLRW